MKNYEKPKLIVFSLNEEDVIRTSGFDGDEVWFDFLPSGERWEDS